MIKLTMTLLPYGSRLHHEELLISAVFYTIPGESRHGFVIRGGRHHGVLLDGSVPKTRSGHRNPLHLLAAVLAASDLDALGENYVTTPYDH